jgi:hypothetical protein
MKEDEVGPEPRRARNVRLVEDARGVSVYPEPHTAPVLPGGWAPLDRADQDAVLRACDGNPQTCRLRLGSPWDAAIEYRVYLLDVDDWQGICTATVFTSAPQVSHGHAEGANVRLLAIARDVQGAARIAVDFLNWDLEAEGLHWRLSIAPAPTSSTHS